MASDWGIAYTHGAEEAQQTRGSGWLGDDDWIPFIARRRLQLQVWQLISDDDVQQRRQLQCT